MKMANSEMEQGSNLGSDVFDFDPSSLTRQERGSGRSPSSSEMIILIGIPLGSTIAGAFDGYALAAHFVGVSLFELLTRPLTDFKPYHSLISASGFINFRGLRSRGFLI